MDHGSDMISHTFKTSVTSLASMEMLFICKGVNEARIRQRPRETLWERVFSLGNVLYIHIKYMGISARCSKCVRPPERKRPSSALSSTCVNPKWTAGKMCQGGPKENLIFFEC